jgi:hypothetical protein
MVARDNGVEKRAIAQIGPSLAFNAFARVNLPLTVNAMPALFLMA